MTNQTNRQIGTVIRIALPILGLLAVHAILITFEFVSGSNAMGDVYFAYEPWMNWIFATGNLLGITHAWVYPYPALIPMAISAGFGFGNFTAGWLLMITLLNIAALLAILLNPRFRKPRFAAVFWLLALLALGPVSISRIDSVSVAIAIIAIALLANAKLTWSTALLTLGAWIKIWPVAILAAQFVADKVNRWRIAAIAIATSAGILFFGLIAGGNQNLLSFILYQTDRGLQVESPAASWWVWRALQNFEDSAIYYDDKLFTYQVSGPGVAETSSLMTLLMVLAVAITLVLIWLLARRGHRMAEILPIASLALVLDLIVFNKVGSPQFATWLAVPIILGFAAGASEWKRLAVAVLVITFFTGLVYPGLYFGVIQSQPTGTVVLFAKNFLLVLLLIWVHSRIIQKITSRPETAGYREFRVSNANAASRAAASGKTASS